MSAVLGPEPFWDAVIVGGGPAGLSAALLLGRCLRKVLLCDNRKPRNSKSHMLNGFLTRDGASPHAFLHVARQQLERYGTVEERKSTVSFIEREQGHFVVVLDSGCRLRARTILLASGVVDELPEVEGVEELYGTSVHSCPFCHGWECRGRRIAVLGDSEETAQLALELTVWSDAVVLCSQGCPRYNEDTQGKLRARNVKFEERVAQRLDRDEEGNVTRMLFKDGSCQDFEAVFVSPRQYQHSNLAQSLGCHICAEDGCLECSEDCRTSIPGVFAAGNASKGIQLVIMAAAEGTRAGVAINDALLEADIQAATRSKP